MDRISNNRAALLGSVATSLVLGALAFSTAAFAQAAPAAAAKEEEAIVVTGSLLKRPDLESAAPVALVTAEDIKLSGNARVEDLLNSLPQVFAAQGANLSNGATGTATVSLRGLGSVRTLVLVDGKRLMPGDLRNSAADLNFIPGALIKRIDVLTGGASTTYGADAVAGVVNFVMDRNFEGLRIDSNYGFYQHDNNNAIRSVVDSSVQGYKAPTGNTIGGGTYDISAVIGASSGDGKGHIVVYAGIRGNEAVKQDTRDFSICSLNPDDPGVSCGGSNLAPKIVRIRGLVAANRALAGVSALGTNVTVDPVTNGLAAYRSGVDAYNFAPENFYLRPATRYTAGSFAKYEINEHAEVYLDFMFMRNRTKAQIAPSGLFSGPGGNGFTVNCDNPFLNTGPTVNVPGVGVRAVKAVALCGVNANVPGQSVTAAIGLRNTAGGSRFDDKGFSSYKILGGLRGKIVDDWRYDAYVSRGSVEYTGVYNNDVSNTKINRALSVVNVAGVPTCKSVVDGTDPNCVPYNIFEVGKISPAALKYISIPLFETGRSVETIANGVISGELGALQSPYADAKPQVAFGVEYREDRLADEVDESYINGEGAGTGTQRPVAGSYTVKEVFSEFSLPIAAGVPGINRLQLGGGARYSEYNNSSGSKTTATTYKIELEYSPVDALTLRASFNRAVRAPNILELFSPNVTGLFSGTDPCSGPTPVATLAACQRTGVTAAQYRNIESNTGANQYNLLSGGFAGLKPEKANSYTFGAVIQPKDILPGFSATVDYFNIRIKDVVGTFGAQFTLNQCLDTGAPQFCSLIKRSTSPLNPGALFSNDNAYVIDTNKNTGSLQARGIDTSVNYKFNIGGDSSVAIDATGTYFLNYGVLAEGKDKPYNCVGYHGTTCGTPTPKWRSRARVTYFAPSIFSVAATWRYQSGVQNDKLNPSDQLKGNLDTAFDAKIPAYSYFDFSVGATVTDKVKVRFGINNVFDKDPPIISSAGIGGGGNGNTYAQVYDTLGRYVFFNLTTDF